LARNEANSIFGQGSAITIDGTLFDEGRQEHLSVQQSSTVTIDNATFQDGEYTRVSEFESGDQLIRQVNYYQSRDMLISSSDLSVRNTTFEGGERGVYVLGNADAPATATLQDCTFQSYNQYATYASGESTELTMANVSFEGIGGYATYCFSCELELTDVSYREMTRYKYRFEYYTDGELLFDNEYEQADPAIYSTRGDISLEDVTIEGAESSAIEARDSTFGMDGVTVRDVVNSKFETAAVDLTWSDTTIVPNAVLNLSLIHISEPTRPY